MIRQRCPRSETPPGAKQKAVASFPPPEGELGDAGRKVTRCVPELASRMKLSGSCFLFLKTFRSGAGKSEKTHSLRA